MLKRGRRKRNFSPARVTDGIPHALDGVPQALAHGAEKATSRLTEAVESAGTHMQPRRLLSRSTKGAWSRRHPSSDAILKAQLVKTSHELARESSDLGNAVDSLNAIIRANRKASAKGRTRLIGGLAIGAGLMYHLDAEHGRERRAATARRLGITVGDH
jgi:hypothetical protein